MKLNDKVMMDKHLSNALDFIDKAVDELDLSKTDKEAIFTRGQITEFETNLIELRDKIYRFKQLTKEVYHEV